MVSATSRATRSSWPPARTGSKTSRWPTTGRPPMRTPRNEGLSPASPASGAGPERTCVLSRAARPKDQLIRLALSPDGDVAPDIRARAPGRGAYVGVGRAALDEANAKGKLKGALARAFKQDAKVPADLGEKVEDALRQ